jgi:hypothetical protein
MANNLTFRLAAALVAVLLSAPAWAQTSRIGGVVRDETGATLRGVIVRAETGGGRTFGTPLTLTTATDDRGRFVFVISRSGEWRLTFEAPGFDPMTMPLALRLTGPAPNLDIKLERRESPEAFGALAGIDSKSLSSQLAAAAVLYDEGRHDQAIAAYREIKSKAPAMTLVNLQIGNSYFAKKSYGDAEAAYQRIWSDLAHDLSFRPTLVLFASQQELDRGVRTRDFPQTGEHILLSLDANRSLSGDLAHEITHSFFFDILPRSLSPRHVADPPDADSVVD